MIKLRHKSSFFKQVRLVARPLCIGLDSLDGHAVRRDARGCTLVEHAIVHLAKITPTNPFKNIQILFGNLTRPHECGQQPWCPQSRWLCARVPNVSQGAVGGKV